MTKLRIIAGRFGSRLISADVGRATHPMGDRVRSALFARLLSHRSIDGARVLDAFAGTGALGLEALSRGAGLVTFIERDRVALRVLRSNVELLGVSGQVTVVSVPVKTWLDTRDQSDLYDIILADPPYNYPQLKTVSRLVEALQPGGLMILSYPGRLRVPYQPIGVVVVDDFRSYGEATLAVFRKLSDR